MGDVKEIQLRRQDNTQSWGFKLKGGIDMGMPLHIEQVNPKGRAAASGLGPGDTVLSICGTNITQMTSQQIKQEMLRGGNELDFIIRKGGMARFGGVQAAAPPSQEPRSQVVEESIPSLGGPKYKDVKPKTYQVIEDEQRTATQGGGGATAKPASIFNRNREERSGYLQAKGKTIQKAYGEGD